MSHDVNDTSIQHPENNIYIFMASLLLSTNAYMFRAQSISNILWALATAGVKVNYKEVATSTQLNTIRSPISTNDPVLQCCAIAAQEFINRPHEFTSQAIANMCWSFAVLDVKHIQFLFVVEREIKNRISNVREEQQNIMSVLSSQDIANILW
jgi:hypothetical protein